MVVSAHPAATEAGIAVLDAGGSAVDAAIAIQLVLNLVEPQSSGIGGGAFMLHWDGAGRRLTTLDGRETAPAAAGPDHFLNPDRTPLTFEEAVPGGRSVGVPGTLALLRLAHELHGRRPWADLLAPAIRLAEEGFPVSPRLAALIAADASRLKPFPATAAYFLEPVCASYRTLLVCGMGPPSSGGVAVAQVLGLLEHVDMRAPGATAEGAHALAEASKLAFADRDLYLADADFVRLPLPGLLDRGYLATRAQTIRLDAAMPKAVGGSPPWRDAMLLSPDERDERPGTSHFTVVDGEGSIVAMTTTIEAGFGSRLMTGGFLLNNELTDVAFQPESGGRPVANRVEGGKRPRSSMAPTIVLDGNGDPLLAIGSPGGSRIIGYVAQAIVAALAWGMSAQEAVSMGHVVNRNGPTELEAGTAVELWQEPLKARGHEVRVMEENSGLHAVPWRDGVMESGVDPRREGAAAGR